VFQQAANKVVGRVGEHKANQIAWGIVKSKFVQEGTNWIAKSSDLVKACPKIIIVKSQDMSPKIVRDNVIAKSLDATAMNYYAELVFGTSDDDDSADLIADSALAELPERMKGDTLDLEHYSLKEAQGKKTPEGIDPAPISRIESARFEDGKLIGTIKYNARHPNFREYWENTVDGWLGASLEVYPVKGKTRWDGEKRIHDEVKYRRITLTKNPQNRYTRVLRAWKQAS